MTLSFYPEYSAKRLKCFLVNSGKYMGYWKYHLSSWESLTWANFSKLFPILHLITSYRKKSFLFSRTSSDMSIKELLGSKFHKAKIHSRSLYILLEFIKPDIATHHNQVWHSPRTLDSEGRYVPEVTYLLLLCQRQILIPVLFCFLLIP